MVDRQNRTSGVTGIAPCYVTFNLHPILIPYFSPAEVKPLDCKEHTKSNIAFDLGCVLASNSS